MKKLLLLVLAASLGAALVGCGNGATDDSAPKTGIKDKTPATGDE